MFGSRMVIVRPGKSSKALARKFALSNGTRKFTKIVAQG
jgi:hypothetical protein